MKLTAFFYNLIKKLGVDRSIAYSSGARIVQAFTGVASIFFIAQFLTEAEQGYYYTFGSIVAIQMFFELGLTNIITQYVAHEASHLYWRDPTNLEGDKKNHSRLAYLLKFSVRWYAIISLLLFVILFIVGYCFFYYYSPNNENVDWKLPWILISIGTALNLFISPLMSILMGLDKMKDVMKMRFYQQLIFPLFNWIGLMLGWHLYVLGISSILSVVFVMTYCSVTSLKGIIVNLWRVHITDKVGYRKEIFPYQWKIALSWISGYFIYQLFNPVLFATEGAEIAGQMGMTLTVLNGISSFSQSWINTKIPLWSKLIALKDYLNLDTIFKITMRQLSMVCMGLILIFFLGVWGLKFLNFSLGYRFLNWFPLVCMTIAMFANQWIFGWAAYIRCHKQEPFVVNAMTIGLLCCLSTIITGEYWGVNGITLSYMIITLVSMIWVYRIYSNKKIEWHEAR